MGENSGEEVVSYTKNNCMPTNQITYMKWTSPRNTKPTKTKS